MQPQRKQSVHFGHNCPEFPVKEALCLYIGALNLNLSMKRFCDHAYKEKG